MTMCPGAISALWRIRPMGTLSIFFAADLHGSEVCFRKFINAPDHYGASIAVLGGDLSAKTFVTIRRSAAGDRAASWGSPSIRLGSEEEVEAFGRRLAAIGVKFHIESEIALDTDANDPPESDHQHLRQRLIRWLGLLQNDRHAGKVRYFWIPGNDDGHFLDDIFDGSDSIQNLDGKVVEAAPGLRLLGLGGSTPTPWHTPREYTEEALEQRLAILFAKCPRDSCNILVSHVPPYNSGLDLAPALTDDFRLIYGPGGVLTSPVGSKAVRTAIESFSPALVLSGHVHESRGYARIGRTLCINPGSIYATGILRGALVLLRDGQVADFQLLEG